MKNLFIISLLVFSFSHQAFSFNYAEVVMKEYKKLLDQKLVLLPHKGTYFLPVSYNDNPNNAIYETNLPASIREGRGDFVLPTEAEIQISFMLLTNRKIWGTDFNTYLAYTSHSWWQVYNSDWSKPFRENNYSPEVFARKILNEPKNILGLQLVAYDFGLIHQSNGQIQEFSRSWDRVFTRLAWVSGSFFIITNLWYRLPEKEDKDYNSDIHKYLGHGSLQLQYNAGSNHYGMELRLGEEYQGIELTYSYPMKEGMRFFVKAVHGYGNSLIDYNKESRSLALGISTESILSSVRRSETSMGIPD